MAGRVRGRTASERIALEEMRMRAVRAVIAGESVAQVAQTLGFTSRAVHNWVAAYRAGKQQALRATKAVGAQAKLTMKQRAKLSDVLTKKSPRQLQMDFGLWTRDLVRALIHKMFAIKLAVTSVGYLLRDLGFTPQKPLVRAYQQNPDAVKRWLKIEYPRIRKAAKAVQGEIFFADEVWNTDRLSFRHDLESSRKNTCCLHDRNTKKLQYAFGRIGSRKTAFYGSTWISND